MKIEKLIVATAAAMLLAPAAFAATTTKHAGCEAQMKAADAAISANPSGSAKAKELRTEGEKLCQEGKTAEGARKLEEAAKAAKATTKAK